MKRDTIFEYVCMCVRERSACNNIMFMRACVHQYRWFGRAGISADFAGGLPPAGVPLDRVTGRPLRGNECIPQR